MKPISSGVEINQIYQNSRVDQHQPKQTVILKSKYVKDGFSRSNSIKFQVIDNGNIMIYINNGHSRATGEKHWACIMLDKTNIELARQFFNEKT